MINIKTQRFTLRSFQLSDAEDVARNVNDRTIALNTATIPYPYPLSLAKKWMKAKVNGVS